MVTPTVALILLSLSPVVASINRKAGYMACFAGSALFLYHAAVNYSSQLGLFYISAGLVWLFSSLYSLYYDHNRWLAPPYTLSILGMALALSTDSLLVFLAGYEIMTIPAYVIMGLYRKTDYPAFVFMAFGELSTILIIVGFLYSYSITGQLGFYPLATSIPITIAAFGFMVKMGTLPFMVTEWLPIAHGNAPPNVSAVLSASMTLVAAYGLTRMALLSPRSDYLGFILLGAGAFSVFFGALYAYITEHAKTLLGFSTIENNGAILSLIGVYLTSPTHMLASFALITTTVYVLAHSLAKTGLFLDTGMMKNESLITPSIVKNRLSDVGAILLACSMSGLLPTIGGVATWALLETLFMEAYALHSTLSVVPIVAGSIIAMGEGFATSTMLKYTIFTHVFNKQSSKEKARPLILLLIGLLIVGTGSTTYLFYRPFLASNGALGIPFGLITSRFTSQPFGAISPLYVLVAPPLIAAVVLAVFGKPKIRRSEAWNSGAPMTEAYNSLTYSNNIRLMLSKLLLTHIGIAGVSVVDVYWSLTHAAARVFVSFSRHFSRVYMNSRLSLYIVYMILTLVVLTVVIMA
jgi:formate hydrogenlyase subunit 3/multisubunit Na+/H+ antiporter MnhD subunit